MKKSINKSFENFMPIKAGLIKKGFYVIFEERLCQIISSEVQSSKIKFHCEDIITGLECEYIVPKNKVLKQAKVSHDKYRVEDIEDDRSMLLSPIDRVKCDCSQCGIPCYCDPDFGNIEDLKVPNSKLGERIIDMFNRCHTIIVTVMFWKGHRIIVDLSV